MATSSKKAETAKTVFLVFGDDADQVSTSCRELVNSLCPQDQQSLSLDVIDGAVDTVDEAVNAVSKTLLAVQTVGFFGAGKTIWLKDASFLSSGEPGKYEEVKKKVGELVDEIKRGVMDGQKLVISSPAVDKRSAFYKACQTAAEVREFSVPDKAREADAFTREALADLIQQHGLRMEESARQALVARVGPDIRMLRQEVEKLDLYVQKRRDVTLQDVLTMVAPTREIPPWELAQFVGERNLREALKQLRLLLAQRQHPILMLTFLEKSAREWLIIKDCIQRRWMRPPARYGNPEWSDDPAVDRMLSMLDPDPRKMHPFRVTKAAEIAAKFSMQELLSLKNDILSLQEQVRSSSVPPELLLELAIIRWLKPQRKSAEAA